MAHDLEAPPGAQQGTWDSLYLSRGDEVTESRPVFTGDGYTSGDGDSTEATLLLQHPCALRIDGVNLVDSLLVAKVTPSTVVNASGWKGNYKVMPLPGLGFDQPGAHAAASFIELNVIRSEGLLVDRRVASLSQVGVNLVLQRWVHHCSRVVVPTSQFQLVTGGPFEEADLTEEWCDEALAHGDSLATALDEAHEWLRGPGPTGSSRQRLLEDPQHRSSIRKEMRDHLRLKYE